MQKDQEEYKFLVVYWNHVDSVGLTEELPYSSYFNTAKSRGYEHFAVFKRKSLFKSFDKMPHQGTYYKKRSEAVPQKVMDVFYNKRKSSDLAYRVDAGYKYNPAPIIYERRYPKECMASDLLFRDRENK